MEDVALPEEGTILHQDSEHVAIQEEGDVTVMVTWFSMASVSTDDGSTENGTIILFSEQEVRIDIMTARIMLLVVIDSIP